MRGKNEQNALHAFILPPSSPFSLRDSHDGV